MGRYLGMPQIGDFSKRGMVYDGLKIANIIPRCVEIEREIERERYREREIERERDRGRDRERGRGRDPRCVVLLALDSFDIWPYIQHTVIYVLRRFTPAAIHFGVRSLRFTICRGDGWWLAEVRHQPRQDVPGDVAVLFNSKE